MEGNVPVAFLPPAESATVVTDSGAPQAVVSDPIMAYAKVRDVTAGETVQQETSVPIVATEFTVRRDRRTARVTGRWTLRSRGRTYNITQVRRLAKPGTVRDEWLAVVATVIR